MDHTLSTCLLNDFQNALTIALDDSHNDLTITNNDCHNALVITNNDFHNALVITDNDFHNALVITNNYFNTTPSCWVITNRTVHGIIFNLRMEFMTSANETLVQIPPHIKHAHSANMCK